MNGTQLVEDLTKSVRDGLYFEVSPADAKVLLDYLSAQMRGQTQLHCATCQCNKLNAPKPVPDSSMSRSWHDNASCNPPPQVKT